MVHDDDRDTPMTERVRLTDRPRPQPQPSGEATPKK